MSSLVCNPDLLNDLVQKRVVIFIGSGISSATSANLPGWKSFLEEQCNDLNGERKDSCEKLLSENDLLLACDIIKEHLGDEWQDVISSKFGRLPTESQIHEEIKKLNQRVIVTTNFDKIVEKFWNDGEYNNGGNFQVIKRINQNSFRFMRGSDGVIIKLHGCVDEADEIIFSKADYISRAYANDHYRKLIEGLLLNYTILFLGFSMTDPAITQLMELFSKQFSNVRPHWIIHAEEKPASLSAYRNKYRRLMSLTYEYTVDHKHLLPLIKELVEQYEMRKRESYSDMLAEGLS